MLNPGLPPKLWSKLDNKLWHATERHGLAGMISDGEIGVGIGDRYKCSLCRRDGSVCLFDFGPTAVDDWGQFNNWVGWFGSQQGARIAIWLEIDRTKCAERLIDAGAALVRSQRARDLTFIPGVEACHKGAIPMSNITGALLISRDDCELFRECSPLDATILDQIAAFEHVLPPAPDRSIIERIEAGRGRKK